MQAANFTPFLPHGWVTIAAVIVGVLYFLTALSAVGTHSYGAGGSAASLVLVIQHMFGKAGALVAGFTSVFICTATVLFLAACFVVVLALYGTNTITLTTLIQLPNATFILTYLGGCAAGIRFLRGTKWGVGINWLSFLLTAVIFPFVGWAMLYSGVIVIGLWVAGDRRGLKERPL